MLRVSRHLTLLAACLALASCWSQVGELSSPPPKAVIATVAQAYTTDSGGVVHTTVRAGADVVLTGTSSYTGQAGSGIPILTWVFSQVNPTSEATVDLIKRTQDTYSFRAPQVSAETTLSFSLTVTDANGRTGTAQAQVTVVPVRDADHYLTYQGTVDTVPVTAVTTTAIPPNSRAAYDAGVGFTITVQKVVDFTDISHVQRHDIPVGPAVSYSGSWSSQLGNGGADCTDQRNPKIQIPIPELNLDDTLAASSGLSGSHLFDVLELSDIGDPAAPSGFPAVVKLQISITSTGGVTPEVCVPGASPAMVTSPAGTISPAGPSTTVKGDDLFAAVNAGNSLGLFDTSATAHAYYNTIDPQGTRTTLTEWLTQNHFTPGTAGLGADAHVIYANNYDLGLGRSMYMKIGPCDSPIDVTQLKNESPSASVLASLTGLIGKCDVASVVVNYVGIQAAAQNINAIVAVAMEYSASPAASSGQRFVKFYVFGPDQRTGEMQRITSVDLDHRGQKPVPQSCLVCHGGLPAVASSPNASTYPAPPPPLGSGIPGDVSAAFLPWDLSSLLYSDTDPGFSQKSQDAPLKAQYTMAMQADQFKLLNWGAYLTMNNPVSDTQGNRFKLARELIEGWYGAASPGGATPAGLPSSYNGAFVPSGWQPSTTGNPPNSATLYTDVFAHSCRMCHTVQTGYNPKITACTLAGHQCAIASYTVMENSLRNFPGLVSQGRMPFARRTADRLWTEAPAGDTSVSTAGAELLAALAAGTPPIAAVPPGTPNVLLNPAPDFVPHGQLDVLSWQKPAFTTGELSGDGGLLDTPTWRVCRSIDPNAVPDSCAGSPNPVTVINSNQAQGAVFQIPASIGTYLVELDAGGTKVAASPFTVQKVPEGVAAPAALPSSVTFNGSLTLDTSALIPVGSTVIGGNGPLTDISWWVTGLNGLTTTSPCVAPMTCYVDQSDGVASTSIVLKQSGSPTTAGSYTINVQDATGLTYTSSPNTVSVTPNLPAIDRTGYVTANPAGVEAVFDISTNQPISFASLAASGDSIQVQVSCDSGATFVPSCNVGSSQPSAGGAIYHGTLSAAGAGLNYTPPPGLSTVGRGGNVLPNTTPTPVTAKYQLVELHNGVIIGYSNVASLTLNVRARVSFADVYDLLTNQTLNGLVKPGDNTNSGNATCTGLCHAGTQTPHSQISFSPSVPQHTLYCELAGCGPSFPPLTAPANPSGPLVDVSDVLATPSTATDSAPPNSVLIRFPANLGGTPLSGAALTFHPGGNRCPPALTTPPTQLQAASAEFTAGPPLAVATPKYCDLQYVLEWIEDGAHEY
jgi:hypothetical protein